MVVAHTYFQLTSTIKTSKMESGTIKKLLKPFEWSLFVLMIIAAAIFVNNSFQNYQSNATGIQVLSKKVDFYVAPTMTVCFQPYKKSMPKNFIKNMTWPEIFQEISYKIGRDFNLTIVIDPLNLKGKREIIAINDIIVTENVSKSIEFEEIITLNNGKCISLAPKSKMDNSQLIQINIQFEDTLSSEDIPETVEVIFTSRQNSYGILSYFYKEGKEYRSLIDPDKKDYNMFYLQLSEHKKLDISGECSNSDFYWNCLSKK